MPEQPDTNVAPDTEAENAAGSDVDNAVLLCPSCLTKNPPTAHFCRECACPLSSQATTDPLGRIHAQGFFYRRIARDSNGVGRPLLAWFGVGPIWLLMLVILPEHIETLLKANTLQNAGLPDLIGIVLLLLGTSYVLGSATLHYLRQRANPRGSEE